MKNVDKTLKKFGLSKNEIKAYLEALKHEEIGPYKLSKLTGIPRTTVYDVITSLSLKGLIELKQSRGLEKRQTKIKAKNPSVLREEIINQRKKLTSLEVDIVEILPELKGDFYKDEPNANFKFYPGIKGARYVMFSEDKNRVDLPMYVWTHLMPMDSFGKEEFNKLVSNALDFRRKAKTKNRKIIPLTDWTKHVLTYQYGRDPDYIKHIEIRYIDNPIFDVNQRISIKGNRLRVVCADEDEIWGLIVNSPSLTKTLQSMFNFMWQLATPVTDEFVRSLGRNKFLEAERKRDR